MNHPNKEISAALALLNDALCTWERCTGRQSVLILREQGGFNHRSVNGKPCGFEDITDLQLLNLIR